MSSKKQRLLVDVSQFASWPAASGVQRVLQHLAQNWEGAEVEASYGFIDRGAYSTGPLHVLASVISSTFQRSAIRSGSDDDSTAELVRASLREASETALPIDDVQVVFDGYLLPEPTLRADGLSVLARLRDAQVAQTFVVYYDALSLTHPEYFPRGADSAATVTRYNSIVSGFDNLAFISEAVRRVFETRIARRRLPNAVVARPGADAMSAPKRDPRDPPVFAVVGTVEPRKRHRLVLDAFESLWALSRRYELVVLGAPGWETPDLHGRLRRLSHTRPLSWVERPSDSDIAETLSYSSALLYPSDSEGYGLPPLESLSMGCPVIVSANLPALEGLGDSGQIRIDSVTQETLRSAIEVLADPVQNLAHRRAIDDLELPTWSSFTRDLEDWIVRRLDAQDVLHGA